MNCGKSVQLKLFHEHAKEKCADEIQGPGFRSRVSQSFLKWDGVSFRENNEFDVQKDYVPKLISFDQLGKTFYLSIMYVAFKKSFLFCVMLAEKGEVASNNNAKMIMNNGSEKLPKRELTSVGPVISIENITSLKSPQTVYESWCVQYEAAKPFLVVKDTSKNNNHDWRVQVPISVVVSKIK